MIVHKLSVDVAPGQRVDTELSIKRNPHDPEWDLTIVSRSIVPKTGQIRASKSMTLGGLSNNDLFKLGAALQQEAWDARL